MLHAKKDKAEAVIDGLDEFSFLEASNGVIHVIDAVIMPK